MMPLHVRAESPQFGREKHLQLFINARRRGSEIVERLDVGLLDGVVPANASQAAQFARNPVSLFKQVVELLITAGYWRRIITDLFENRPL